MNSIGLRFTSLVRRIAARMSSTNSSYEEAIRKLNSLQSNKSTIEQIKQGLKTGQRCTNLEDMENYLSRVGIPLSTLDQLSVIHVAGTKGKGSSSAMCESILRHHGYHTGFYSSPHLVAARERIRLDGQPLSREDFAHTLHHVYGLLYDTQEYEGDMPKYFAFLTVCAFHEFLRRRVDVAVVEVGIGGIVDYTNVLRKVPVVGITALGLDHTSILGSTLPEIAAAKAGVMKQGCDAYTVTQDTAALRVLEQYADTVKCPLTIVPDYETYKFESSPQLPVDLDAYRTNASLATQLAHAWMRQAKLTLKSSSVREYAVNGLVNNNNLELKCTNEHTKLNGVLYKSQNGLNKNKSIDNGIEKEITTEKQSSKVSTNGYSEANEMNGINSLLNKEMIAETDAVINGNVSQNIMTNSNKLTKLNKAVNGINISQQENDNMRSDSINMNGGNKLGNGITNGNIVERRIRNGNTFENGITNGQHLPIKFENGIANGNLLEIHVVNGNKFENGMTNGNRPKTNGPKFDNRMPNGNSSKFENETRNGNILGKLVLQVPLPTVQGLSQCRWPGRYQVIQAEFAKFYLDGAHTKESMEICARWFLDNSSSQNKSLIFSATGDRNAATLLLPLTNIPFQRIYFVSPTAHKLTYKSQDNYSLIEQRELEERCQKHARIWREKNINTEVYIFECVADALESIKKKNKEDYNGKRSNNEKEDNNGIRSKKKDEDRSKIGKQSVLITGSLHLVGAALSLLDPSLSS